MVKRSDLIGNNTGRARFELFFHFEDRKLFTFPVEVKSRYAFPALVSAEDMISEGCDVTRFNRATGTDIQQRKASILIYPECSDGIFSAV